MEAVVITRSFASLSPMPNPDLKHNANIFSDHTHSMTRPAITPATQSIGRPASHHRPYPGCRNEKRSSHLLLLSGQHQISQGRAFRARDILPVEALLRATSVASDKCGVESRDAVPMHGRVHVRRNGFMGASAMRRNRTTIALTTTAPVHRSVKTRQGHET